MEYKDKIVDFTKCAMCKHKEKAEKDEPCSECLKESARIHSHIPLKFEKVKE